MCFNTIFIRSLFLSLTSGTGDVNPDSSEVQRLQRLRDEVHRLKREESLLDRNYLLAQNLLKTMSEDEYNQKLAYLTHTDIRNIPEFGEETLLAVKAPYGSTLEVPDPDEVGDDLVCVYFIYTFILYLH